LNWAFTRPDELSLGDWHMSTVTLTEEQQENLWAKVHAHLTQGGTLGELRGFTEKEYEALFLVGHTLYGQKKYADAEQVFAFLVMNNPYDRRFAQALGSAKQMLGQFADAIGYYSVASMMEMTDPVPTFHTAECLAALGHTQDAMEALGFAIKHCTKPEHAKVKQRASGMLDILRASAAAAPAGDSK